MLLYANAWAVAIATLAVISSSAYFIHPQLLVNSSNSVGETFGLWAYAWNAFYLLGGIGMLVGLFKPSRAIDMMGLSFMAGALFINGIATFFARHGAAAAAPSLFALAIAAVARLRILYIAGKL